MTSFNAKLNKAHSSIDANSRQVRQAKEERALLDREWAANEARQLMELRLRTLPKMQILRQLENWLRQERHLKQLGKPQDGMRTVLVFSYESHDNRYTILTMNNHGRWACQGYVNADQNSNEFREALDSFSYEQFALAIAEMAYQHGWELPDIDLDVPDEPATAAPTTEATLKTHPKWTAIFRARKEQHLSKES